MYVRDTIVAPATAPGTGSVAIVRMSGPESLNILRAIWNSQNKATLEPRKLYLGSIVDPQTDLQLDEAMAVFFRHPHSQTGEDVVELQCHGSSYLIRRITALAMRLGARMAEPGEFTRRAFLNGRMDLTEAEAIADLVEARSENALRQSISHLIGTLAIKLNGMRRRAYLYSAIWKQRLISPMKSSNCPPVAILHHLSGCSFLTLRSCTIAIAEDNSCARVPTPPS